MASPLNKIRISMCLIQETMSSLSFSEGKPCQKLSFKNSYLKMKIRAHMMAKDKIKTSEPAQDREDLINLRHIILSKM